MFPFAQAHSGSLAGTARDTPTMSLNRPYIAEMTRVLVPVGESEVYWPAAGFGLRTFEPLLPLRTSLPSVSERA